MAEVLTPALKERLWHQLRADLASILPSLANDERLVCCCCGRLLPFQDFSLEHIIPQQALAGDPPNVKAAIPTLKRSGYTLLCNTPLRLGGRKSSANGCNSWKGQYFDTELRKVFEGSVLNKPPQRGRHAVISGIVAAYLALFSRFGYQVAMSSAGLALRRQFFVPSHRISEIPIFSEMLMTGEPWDDRSPELDIWGEPFTFDFHQPGFCSVNIRNYIVSLPISRDPRIPIAVNLPFVPARYKMRPDFRSFFD